MTIKAVAFIEKPSLECLDILANLTKLPNLEITNFVYHENTILNIDGLIQFNGSLNSALQQMKCEFVVIFNLSDLFLDILSKIQPSESHLSVILIPININITNLTRIKDYSAITLYTCLPFRHLKQLWKIHKAIINKQSVLQYIECSLVVPTLSLRYRAYGYQHCEINMNNFYRLSMIDIVQFVCGRYLFKVQAVNRAVEWEMKEEHKNEKHLDDYSIIIGYFKPKDNDLKLSLTSKSGTTLLSPRTCLIKVRSSSMEDEASEEVSLKMKIKSTSGVVKEKVGSGGSGVVFEESKKKEEERGSFWSCDIVREGLESFVAHVEFVRQQSAPRLVDLGTLTEEDMMIAERSLISVADLLSLCDVVGVVDQAACSGHTVVVD